MAITLYENFRGVVYTPFYAAHALGAYAAEGVDVEMTTSPEPAETAQGLIEERVDVSWGGPMRIMANLDREPDCGIVGFCEAVARDPFFLVGRTPNPSFRFHDLMGPTVAPVFFLTTPWMCLQDDVRRAGLDPAKLKTVDQTMEANLADFRAGRIDVLQTFEPHVEMLQREGAGHLWHAAAERGPTAYTTFYTTRRVLAEKPDPLYRMARAMYRTQKWLHSHDATDVAALVAPDFFPEVARDVLTAAVARYLTLGVWSSDPVLPRDGFERLKAALLSGGLIERDIPYEEAIETSFARRAVDENPPAM